jgi:hypothetical protein
MNFTNLLPFEKYVLATDLSVEEVLKRLAGCMQSESDYSWSSFRRIYIKPYRGAVSGLTFRMIRNINYRNSFLPVINGRVTSMSGRTEVMISMRPAYFVLVFMAFWLGMTGLVCIGIIVAGIAQFREILHNGFSPVVFIPFAMFAFGSGLTFFAFKAESKVSKQFLADLLKAK